ncbi:MAG TPA: DUF4870 domain-containing protein [Candidatus Sulfotelmatobacter sp.]|jgi:uncharacterized membrane protein|nr:DUF4870 domain-containing protein [Candidatus Sulfotelmatobacter sp.]
MPHCTKCGAAIADNAAFCPSCGATQGAAASPSSPASTQSGLAENVAGLLCYVLGWITGLIFYLTDKRPFVRFHAAQSIVVFGALTIIRILVGMVFVTGGLAGVTAGLSFGILLFWLISLVGVILWILLMVKAYQGERYRVPIAADLADKLFGKS